MPDRPRYGGTCIRASQGSGTIVVFIHGVLSNGERAWMNGEGKTWPSLLAADPMLGYVGIYSFSYRTDLFSSTYSMGDVVDSIREFFTLDDLWGCNNVIFVCHSMGGIAARRFIVVNQTRFIEHNTKIGLFLVASPSLGSGYANAGAFLARMLRHAQADILRFSQSNHWLNDLDREFMSLKESRRIAIAGKELYEDEPLKIARWLGIWTQIVEPFSAARYFGEPYKVPVSDHVSIAKPVDADEIQHRLLVRFISDMWSLPDAIPLREVKEARTALAALSERLEAGKLTNKSAVAAFSEALIETRRYIADVDAGAARDRGAEGRLSGLWHQAGMAVQMQDPDLAALCMVKSNGWVDEGVWDDPRYRDLPIKLNDMLQSLREIGGQKAVDIVEGQCEVTTVDWRARVMLPPFAEPPEITLSRPNGGAPRDPTLESVTRDQFTMVITSSDQAGTWAWRARGKLLR